MNRRSTRLGTTYNSFTKCCFVSYTVHKHRIQNTRNLLRNISIATSYYDLHSFSTNPILVNATTWKLSFTVSTLTLWVCVHTSASLSSPSCRHSSALNRCTVVFATSWRCSVPSSTATPYHSNRSMYSSCSSVSSHYTRCNTLSRSFPNSLTVSVNS